MQFSKQKKIAQQIKNQKCINLVLKFVVSLFFCNSLTKEHLYTHSQCHIKAQSQIIIEVS